MNDNLTRKHAWCSHFAQCEPHSAVCRLTAGISSLSSLLLCFYILCMGPEMNAQMLTQGQHSESVQDMPVRHLRGGGSDQASVYRQWPGIDPEGIAVDQPRLLKLSDLAQSPVPPATTTGESLPPVATASPSNFRLASPPVYGGGNSSSNDSGNSTPPGYGGCSDPAGIYGGFSCHPPTYGGEGNSGRRLGSGDASAGTGGSEYSGGSGTTANSTTTTSSSSGDIGSGNAAGANGSGSVSGSGNGVGQAAGGPSPAPAPHPGAPAQNTGDESNSSSGTSGSSSSRSSQGSSSAGGAVCSRDRVSAPTNKTAGSSSKSTGSQGVCGMRLVAVEFTVNPAAVTDSMDTKSGGSVEAVSVTMCAEPAAYSPETGTLTMSFCWRPADLPDILLTALAAAMSTAAAAAAADAAAAAASAAAAVPLRVTLPGLQRYGVASMAAGNYTLTVAGTVGGFGAVVHGAAAAAGGENVTFGPFSAAGDGDGTSVVTLPSGGASALTFWFDTTVQTLAASYKGGQSKADAKATAAAEASAVAALNWDALIADASGGAINITMVGPPNPPDPGTTCKCPVTAPSPAACIAAGLAPLVAAGGDGSAFVVQCVPTPQYDKISRKLSFSTCWRYGCLPAVFARMPYTLLLGPLTGDAVGSPPAGTYQLRSTAPDGVAVSYQWTAAAAAPDADSGSLWSLEAATAAGSTVTVPVGGLGQMRILIEVPFDMDVDDASGTVELVLAASGGSSSSGGGSDTSSGGGGGSSGGGSGGSSGGGGMTLETPDGSAATPPPLPAEATAANATLHVVSELWVSRRLGSGSGGQQAGMAALEAAVRQKMEAGGLQAADLNVTVTLLGFRLVLPLEFRDFSAVSDCGQTSLATLRAAAATALASSSPGSAAATLLSVGCSYGAYSGGGAVARRRGRSVQQTCTPRVNAPVTVDTTPVDLDAFLASATSSLTSAYGSSACALDPASSSIQVTSKVAIAVAAPAAKMVAATGVGGGGGGGGGTSGSSATACSSGALALASSLGLADGQARLVGCQLSAQVPDPVNDAPASSPPPTPGAGGGAGGAAGNSGSGSRGVSTTLIAAAVAGGGAAVIVAALAAVVIRKRRRSRRSTFDEMDSSTLGDKADGAAAAATNGTGGGDEKRRKGPRGAVKPFQVDSDDSAETVLIDAKPMKRVRISSAGGGGGGLGGSHDPVSSMGPSSRSIRSSRTRAGSSNLKGCSPRPSGYGSDSITGGGGGGLESAFLSIVPPLTAAVSSPEGSAPEATAPAVMTAGRRLSGTGGAVGPEIQAAASYWPDSPVRQGRTSAGFMARMARVSHPGCPIPTRDDDLEEDPTGGLMYEEQSFPARCSRLIAETRFSNGGVVLGGVGVGSPAPAGPEAYDYFGFEDVADDVGPASNVMASLPPSSAAGGGTRLAARRSSDGGGAAGGGGRRSCRRSRPALRRSDNGGNLSSSDSEDGDGEDDFDISGAGEPLASGPRSKSGTPTPPASPPLGTAAAAAAGAVAAGAPRTTSAQLPPLSPTRVSALRALQYSFALPGADTEPVEEPLPYGIDPVRTDSDFGGAGAGAGAPYYGPFEDADDRDLLRVQSRRPAFLDRTGGTLAAAVAATVAAPSPTGDAFCTRRSYSRTLVPRVEPRRGGFIRRNSVAPHLSTLSPPHLQYIRAQNAAAGSATWGAGGGNNAWSVPASAANSPGSGQVGLSLWAGVVGIGRRRASGSTGGRRSSAGGGGAVEASAASGMSSIHAAAAATTPAACGGGGGDARPRSAGDSSSAGRRLRAPPPLGWPDGVLREPAGEEESGVGRGASAAPPAAAAASRPSTGLSERPASGARRAIRRPPQIHVSGSMELVPDLDQGGGDGGGGDGGDGSTRAAAAAVADNAGPNGQQRPPTSSSSGPTAGVPQPPPYPPVPHPSPHPPTAPLAGDSPASLTSRRLPPLTPRRAAHSDFGTTVHVASASPAGVDPGGSPYQGGTRGPSRSIFVTIGPVVPPESLSSPSPLLTPSLQPIPPPPPSPSPDAEAANAAAPGGVGSAGDAARPSGLAAATVAAAAGGGGSGSHHRNHRASEDSGGDSSGGSSGGSHPPLEELNPAFGPCATMRARQMYGRSSSCGSSNAGSFGRHGLGGLVDKGVEANAEGGAARLAMMRRLAVGPPRPAWGLVHAGTVPFKRSIASLQYLQSVKDRTAAGPGAAEADPSSLLPLGGLGLGGHPGAAGYQYHYHAPGAIGLGLGAGGGGAAAAAGSSGPGGGGGGGGGGGAAHVMLPPGRLLHRNSTGSMRNGSFQSSDMSGPFLRLVGEV